MGLGEPASQTDLAAISYLGVSDWLHAGLELGGDPDPERVRTLDLTVFSEPRESGGHHEPAREKGTEMGTPNATSGRKERREEPEESMFVLSEALPVVPAKLVRRILRAEYVDMAELLKDNMEAERRRMQADGGGMQHYQGRSSRREIPDIVSWVQCFGLYAAVVTSRYPEKTKELLAYQTMIVSEARRLGGRGWLLYDAQFRQQVSSFSAVDFSRINQSLYATTFLAYGGGGRQKVCPDCLMSDHAYEDCALHPNRTAPVVQMREVGGVHHKGQEVRRKRERAYTCFAWNEGRCTYVKCRYDHVCSRCGGDHRKAQCKEGPVEKRRDQGPGGRGQ